MISEIMKNAHAAAFSPTPVHSIRDPYCGIMPTKAHAINLSRRTTDQRLPPGG